MSRCTFFQFTLSLLNILIKKDMGKTKKNEPDLKWWTSRPHHIGCKIQKNKSGYTIAELRPQLQKGSNKPFFNS